MPTGARKRGNKKDKVESDTEDKATEQQASTEKKNKPKPQQRVSFDISGKWKGRQRDQSARPATDREGFKEAQRQKLQPI